MENTIYIKYHSLVDVITNSSTVTYTWADSNAVEIATGMIEKMMKIFGVEGEVSDYFDIYLCPDPEWEHDQREYRDEEDGMTDEEFEEFIAKAEYDNWSHMTLAIKSKQDTDFNLTDEFYKMFSFDSAPEY